MKWTYQKSLGKIRLLLSASLILLLLISTGCSNRHPEGLSLTGSALSPSATPALPLPAPVKTQKVTWVVLTPEKVSTLGPDWVYFAITPEDARAFANNYADAIRWISEARFQLEYYREGQTTEITGE